MSDRPPLVDVDWLRARLQRPDVVVLDTTVLLEPPRFDGDYRVDSGYASYLAAHIPGARFADLKTRLSDPAARFHFTRPAPESLAAALRSLGVGNDSHVVLYDADVGFWSARAWWLLHTIGIRASVLDGGLRAWTAKQYPVQSGEPAPGTTATEALRIVPDAARWIDLAGVRRIAEGTAPGTLVCALSADVFAGRAPTRYARRGHIPRSRNLPARSLQDEIGRYRPAGQLKDQLAPLLAQERPLVLYCGGGISAAVNALALTLVGETSFRMYDGSLEEWASDPELPLIISR